MRTPEEIKEAHRICQMNYSKKTPEKNREKAIKHYNANKEAINLRRKNARIAAKVLKAILA